MKNTNTSPKALFVKAVTSVDEENEQLVDKNGREYKRITVSKVDYSLVFNPITGKDEVAVGKTKESGFKAYKKNYLDREDFGWTLEPGKMILGDLITKNTTPYEIDGRIVNTATALVVANTNEPENFKRATAAAFKDLASQGKDQPVRFTVIEDVVEEAASAVVSAIPEGMEG